MFLPAVQDNCYTYVIRAVIQQVTTYTLSTVTEIRQMRNVAIVVTISFMIQ